MWSIFTKEINSFLNSLIAYLVMGVFLVSMGLLVWVFPDTAIFEYGYADMGIFFNLAPYVLMFLIPAITMKALAEESKSGTFELLMTKPITELKLLLGKYLAGLVLVVISLIPTLVYYFSLSYLSNPVGNIDSAGIMGAYVGLLFLVSAYTGIGIFASSLSENQIVSFIIAVFISFIFFMGFSSVSDLPFLANAGFQVEKIGMLAHYDSLGKGVIDFRDVLYFLSITALFLGATFLGFKIAEMEFLNRKTTEYTLKFLILLTLVILVNLAMRHQIFRWDLTEEKRYSMNEATISMLQNLEEPVYVEVYLAGDINAEFSRLQTAIKQTLEQFKTYAYGNLQYSFINPDEASSANARNEFYRYLVDKGIQPTTVFDNSEGKKTQKLIFPGAEISYGGRSLSVILLNGNNAAGASQAITQSIENLEYEIASTIKSLANPNRQSVALFQGKGAPSGKVLKGLNDAISSKYDLIPVQNTERLSNFDATIFLRPTEDFSNSELYDIDQFIMNGGKSLFFLDGLMMDVDSIKEYGAMALPIETGLDNLLYNYGVRVNKDVLQDVNSGNFPIVTGNLGKDPQIQLLPWPYYIILNKYAEHPIVRNMNAVYGKFVSSIDTVTATGIKKTPLIFTSDYTRKLNGPIHISFENLREDIKPENFNLKNVPVTYLLEGEFTSAYQNRLPPEGKENSATKNKSNKNSIIVASDGDLLLSEIDRKNDQPFPLGVDPYANHPSNFANDQLILNMLNYLLDEDGLIISRNKDLKIRPLDKVKVAEDKVWLQFVNVVLPIVLIVLFGILRYYWRKRKYSKFNG